MLDRVHPGPSLQIGQRRATVRTPAQARLPPPAAIGARHVEPGPVPDLAAGVTPPIRRGGDGLAGRADIPRLTERTLRHEVRVGVALPRPFSGGTPRIRTHADLLADARHGQKRPLRSSACENQTLMRGCPGDEEARGCRDSLPALYAESQDMTRRSDASG